MGGHRLLTNHVGPNTKANNIVLAGGATHAAAGACAVSCPARSAFAEGHVDGTYLPVL